MTKFTNKTLELIASKMSLLISRPTHSQQWSFKIRRTAFQYYRKFGNLLFSRLCDCERVGRVEGIPMRF